MRAAIKSSPRRRHDVVFYTPWIGAILSSRESLPPGGAETQILMLARLLAQLDLSVAIIVYGLPSDLPPEVDGVTLIPRPLYSKSRLVGKFVELARIWRRLHQARAEVIVHRGASPEVGILAAYAVVARRRLIQSSASVVDFDPGRLISKRRNLLMYEYGVRRADAVVVQSEEQVRLCRQRFRREPRLIPNLSPLAPVSRAEPEAFLWVGRLVSYKRPLDYLALARAVPEARFWMVGVPGIDPAEQPLTGRVMEEAAKIPNLELLPPRRHAEIECLMGRAVASVNTSEFEGMPNVLLEAWSRGVPALVLRHDPDHVITRHGLGGFADGSPEKLAELAREQWASRHDRQDLAERCRRYIAEHHSPQAVVSQWLDVLGWPPSGLPLTSPESVCAA